MLTLSSLEPFVLSNMLILTVLGKFGKLISSLLYNRLSEYVRSNGANGSTESTLGLVNDSSLMSEAAS